MALTLLMTALTAAFPGPAHSAIDREVVSKEKDLEDVKKRLRETSETIEEMGRSEKSLLGELDKVGRDIDRKRNKLAELKASIGKTKKSIDGTDKKITYLTREKREFSKKLAARMRAMYKMRGGTAVKLIFSSSGAEELGRRYKLMGLIMEADAELIDRSEENLASLAVEKARLVSLKKGLNVSVARLKVSKREAEGKGKEKRGLLSGIKREKKYYEKLSGELKGAAQDLTDIILKLKKEAKAKAKAGGAFRKIKGSLPMPVKGVVVSSYGKVKHPRFNTFTFNNGIVIEAPRGTPVNVVFGGKVAYEGWLKGYGKVMIVEHDGGFYSLYGHLSRAAREVGEAVEEGDVVGLVGDSGLHGAPALYFEVREGGVPRDPMAWLKVR